MIDGSEQVMAGSVSPQHHAITNNRTLQTLTAATVDATRRGEKKFWLSGIFE